MATKISNCFSLLIFQRIFCRNSRYKNALPFLLITRKTLCRFFKSPEKRFAVTMTQKKRFAVTIASVSSTSEGVLPYQNHEPKSKKKFDIFVAIRTYIMNSTTNHTQDKNKEQTSTKKKFDSKKPGGSHKKMPSKIIKYDYPEFLTSENQKKYFRELVDKAVYLYDDNKAEDYPKSKAKSVKLGSEFIKINWNDAKEKIRKDFNARVEKFNGGVLPDEMKKLVEKYSKPGDPGKPFTPEELEERRVLKAKETFYESLKKHKLTIEDLARINAEHEAITKKPKATKPKKSRDNGQTGRGGVAKAREAEYRFIEEKGGVIQHKLKGHTAEATYIGDEKFKFTFNGVEKTAKISGFCKAHAEELIRTGTQCSLAYNGWDACNIKGWNKGDWGQ